MDLLSIVRAIWHHKIVAIPVILLTVLGALYVLVVKPSVYVASSDLLLVNPPPAPTQAQITADPSQGKINTDNPYVDLGDLWTADALISLVTSGSPPAQITLSSAADDPPIISITSSASGPQAAETAAATVTSLVKADLYQMQNRQHVNDEYMIKTVQLVRPGQGKPSNGGKLRSLIAVLGIGALLLFIAISAAQAVDKRRTEVSISPDTPVWAAGAARPFRRRTGGKAAGTEALNGASQPQPSAQPQPEAAADVTGTEALNGTFQPQLSADVIRTALQLTEVAEHMLSADAVPAQFDDSSPRAPADLCVRRRIRFPQNDAGLRAVTRI
jgi:hypothetical protein